MTAVDMRYARVDNHYKLRHVKRSWISSIVQAIRLGDADAAANLTTDYVRRLREVSSTRPLIDQTMSEA